MPSFAVPLRRSIRFRLSLVIAGVIFLAVMTASAVSAWRDLKQSAGARAELLEIAASGFSASVSDPLAQGDRPGIYEALRGVRDLKSVVHVSVRDAAGETKAQLGGGAVVRSRTQDLRLLSGLGLLSADNATVRKTIVKGGENIGEMVILADIRDLRHDLTSSLGWTAIVAMLAILGGVAVAQVFIARLTRPIRDLAAMMAEVGARQDFSRRMPPAKRRDETAVLGEAFNDMLFNIRKRDDQIAHHVETLEQTVEERTHDLRLAKEDAESANAAKSDFLATMSHEIRTPMNGMMVMAEMLAAADLSSRHRRYAEIITRSGASLLTIINDILDLSKIEAGKLDLEAVPFSPEALAEDVASLFWEKARSKGLELAVHTAPEVPSLVIGDPTRVNQVVTNLVNNALKFTEKGGVIIDLSMEAKDGRPRLRIAVTDTGVGIEQSRIGAIFEAFSQADQSTTRKFGGTGLGLTVCKRLVDAMGGEIVVTSAPGKGSTFTVLAELPVEKLAPAKPAMAGVAMALALPSPLLTLCLVKALKDIGCEPRLIASPRDAKAGEIVLTQSDLLAKLGGAPGAFNICLTDVGDNRVDALIRDRVAVDLLPLPLGRQALWDFAARAVRFEFRGPAALANSVAAAPTETFGHLSILAVDDNAVNREVLREALLSLGVEANFVSNGAEAVDAAKAKAYDVVFMDGSMPEMDGFTATRLIREHEGSAQVRRSHIVALTAQVRGADAEAWAAAGADRHMTKPFTAARLTEVLKAATPGTVQPVPTPSEQALLEAGALIDDEAVSAMEAVSARSGRDVVGKVWKLFLGQAPDAVIRLEALAGQANLADVAKQAHFLKSMSLSAGAARLAALCETIESEAKSGNTAAFAHVAGIRPLTEKSCAAMSARLAGGSRTAVAS